MDEQDLRDCTVRIDIDGRQSGTGFFVSDKTIVTCAHVVLAHSGEVEDRATSSVTVVQGERRIAAKVDVAYPAQPANNGHYGYPDIAFLQIEAQLPDGFSPRTAALDSATPARGDILSVFGHPDFFPNGDSSSLLAFEGITNGSSSRDGLLFKVNGAQVRPGISGAPVLNQRTGRVCAMMKQTRDKASDLGGLAVPAQSILWHRPDLQRGDGHAINRGFDERAQRIHELRVEIEDRWALTFLGEDELSLLTHIAKQIDSREPRTVISTKFAYWGPMPTYNWVQTCNDPAYSMLPTIRAGGECAKRLTNLRSTLKRTRATFVSLGIGDGRKDATILQRLYATGEPIVYCPVELSLEMLWQGRQAVRDALENRLDMPVAIQRDIESDSGMAEIALIAHRVDNGEPKLYSLLGNTLSNTDDPFETLCHIKNAMRPEDLLLVEAWCLDDAAMRDTEVRASIRDEYLSHAFRLFALSGLSQNTDLQINFDDDRAFEVEVDEVEVLPDCRVLAADWYYINYTETRKVAKVLGVNRYHLNPGKQLRIVRSMRFTASSLDRLFLAAGLEKIESQSFALMPKTRSQFSVLRVAGATQ